MKNTEETVTIKASTFEEMLRYVEQADDEELYERARDEAGHVWND